MRLSSLAAAVAFGVVTIDALAMSSANFSIPISAINSGVGSMSSPGFSLVSSLGDAVGGAAAGSGKRIDNGFMAQLYGINFSCILDVDGDTKVEAATDGLMILRAMFGLSGTAVTSGAVGAQATKTQWSDIQPMIHYGALDIDGNGKTDALTDGVLLMRALFGLTGTAVTTNALGQGATRTTYTAIRDYLNSVCGTALQ